MAICTLSAAAAQDGSVSEGGRQRNIVFSDYPEFSRSLEVARRALSPLENAEMTRSGALGAGSQAIDLTHETFSIYVPRKHPSKGYGVLVFIPPWQGSPLPAGWEAVLDDSGVIFVCASKSGNEESIFDRRIPLALLGAHNILRRYPVDADRVYIGGFSGGSRVALRVALAYPDVFHGALLNAGSDPIGNREAVLPPDELFAQFQSATRIVYLTGSQDEVNVDHDMGSRVSMNAWCVFGTQVETVDRLGHDIATASSVRRAIAELDRRSPVEDGKLASCRARIAKELASELGQVGHLLDLDKPHEAWRILSKIDVRYGGLASPEIIEFERRIGPRR